MTCDPCPVGVGLPLCHCHRFRCHGPREIEEFGKLVSPSWAGVSRQVAGPLACPPYFLLQTFPFKAGAHLSPQGRCGFQDPTWTKPPRFFFFFFFFIFFLFFFSVLFPQTRGGSSKCRVLQVRGLSTPPARGLELPRGAGGAERQPGLRQATPAARRALREDERPKVAGHFVHPKA